MGVLLLLGSEKDVNLELMRSGGSGLIVRLLGE